MQDTGGTVGTGHAGEDSRAQLTGPRPAVLGLEGADVSQHAGALLRQPAGRNVLTRTARESALLSSTRERPEDPRTYKQTQHETANSQTCTEREKTQGSH